MSQVAYENSKHGVYELLDELANEKIIQINDAVKPWSRAYIAGKLQEARDNEDLMSNRQQQEVGMYLKDYRLELRTNTSGMGPMNAFPGNDHLATALDPLSFSYRDSNFTLSIRPQWGAELLSNKNQTVLAHQVGVQGFGYYQKSLGIYANYRFGYDSEQLRAPTFLHLRPGQRTELLADDGNAYHDLRWGIMYSWKWGAFGVVNDRAQWGPGYYGSNIISAHAPAFTQIRLQLTPARWFEFNYIHGWLHSDVIDSSRSFWSGNNYEEVMRRKYIAANLFTIKPVTRLEISAGNSIIYGDGPVQAAYLIPFLFFRLADYELSALSDNASSNSQMFFSISSRNIRHLHLYFSMFIDELSIYRFGDEERNNFFSYKGGFRLGNWPLKNVTLTAEYTYTLPAVYDHYISTTTFASDSYTLGHYMQDNIQDLFIALSYKPLPRMHLTLSYNFGQHGSDTGYDGEGRADEIPMLEEISWQKNMIGINVTYQFLSNASVFASIRYSYIQGFELDERSAEYYFERFSPELFWEETVTGRLGFKIGL